MRRDGALGAAGAADDPAPGRSATSGPESDCARANVRRLPRKRYPRSDHTRRHLEGCFDCVAPLSSRPGTRLGWIARTLLPTTDFGEFPGTISEFDDAINSKGFYFEFNNGPGSIEPVLYSNRFALPTFMRNTLFQYSSIDEVNIVMNTMRSDYPCIVGVCQPDRGIHFELSPETYHAVSSPEDLSIRANQFMYPDWGIPPLPGAAGWYSESRQGAFEKAPLRKGAEYR